MRRSGLFIGVVILLITMIATSSRANAQSIYTDWTNATNITHEYLPEQNTDTCIKGVWSIRKEPGQNYPYPWESEPHEICAYHQKNFVYAMFSRNLGTKADSYLEVGLAVAFGDDISKGILTPVDWTRSIQVFHNPASEDLFILRPTPSYSGSALYRIRNYTSHLTYDSEHGHYESDAVPEEVKVNGKSIATYGLALSKNSKWLAIVTNDSLIRYDVINEMADIIGMRIYYSYSIWPSPEYYPYISNDGTIMGYTSNHGIYAFQLSDECLRESKTYVYKNISADSPLVSACKQKDFTAFVDPYAETYGYYVGGSKMYDHPTISEDKASIIYRSKELSGNRWHRISYKPQPILQYLALGDSFASGEGELFDGNYLAGTNVFGNYANGVPREMCHLSNRSYPMLLGNSMQLQYGGDMRSVACSGSETKDIISLTTPYFGSTTYTLFGTVPRLKPLKDPKPLQDQAREDFTPGRIEQIDFVKKVKPAVMTVMAGHQERLPNFDRNRQFRDRRKSR